MVESSEKQDSPISPKPLVPGEPTDDGEFRAYSRQRWDNMSQWYEKFERFAMQSTTTCLEMTNTRSC